MKLNTPPDKRAIHQSGFTLIEMIGVLAVIAILAALLIPKVFNAIADAKINNAVVSAETVKTAIADHYGKYGRFDTIFGTNSTPFASGSLPYSGYDTNVLMFESLLDKPFQTKLGTGWTISLVAAEAPGTAVIADGTLTGAGDASYCLDGNTATKNEAAGQFVMEAVITGVAEADAQAISARLDGPALSTTTIGQDDLVGRVKYKAPTTAGGATTVYIYLTHR